ncbi:MAG TPA: hypothetical protein PK289_00215 [Bacteroidia bacterium]|nr:hypothetical protein [Bacteroidia bacterium]
MQTESLKNVSPTIGNTVLPAVCPKLSAIAHIWDNEEKHMVSCMDDYFKQGLPEIEIAICNNETGKEVISAKVKAENFYKSEGYLRCFPNGR